MILDSATRSLEIVLGEARATADCSLIACYALTAGDSFTTLAAAAQSNGATPVTVVAPPLAGSQCQVNEVRLYNADSVAHLVTLRLNDAGTLTVVLAQTVPPGAGFLYSPTAPPQAALNDFSALTGTAAYGQLPAELAIQPVSFAFAGKPAAAAVVNVPMAVALTIPAAMAGALSFSGTAPAAAAAFTVSRVSGGTTTALGTLTLAAGSATAVTLAGAGGALAAGDVLQLTAPATQDTALANVGITLVARRV